MIGEGYVAAIEAKTGQRVRDRVDAVQRLSNPRLTADLRKLCADLLEGVELAEIRGGRKPGGSPNDWDGSF